MPTQDEIYQKARELAFKDWPAAFPYGRARWVQENYRTDRYITLAKRDLRSRLLKPCAEKLLASFPLDYRDRAEKAVAAGKAFCPSCVFSGHMNCGNFDECGAYIDPTGAVAAIRT